MKKKVIIISIILLIIISLITCYFLFFNNTLVKFSTNKIEINKQVYNTDLVISLRNGKILSDKEQLDTSKLGTYNINIKIKEVFNKEKEYNVTYEVVDTTPPVITYNKEITTSIGKKIDLLKNISAEDNSKEDIEVTTEGDYNINKEGTYDIYYIAKDSSNNIAKEKATLKVTNNNNNNTDDIVMMEDNTFTTKNGFEGYTKNGLTYINGILIANKTYYLPSNYAPGLNSEVKEKAQEMFNDAAKKGYQIKLQSGFRSYDTQKKLYNNYVARDGKKAADTYSARPGYSEHQTGLAFDVCTDGLPCISSGYDNTEEAKWISDNCYKYGFILRYPKGKENETGYMYESWHLRYIKDKDIAEKLYNNGNWITLESYLGITSEYNE